MTAWWRKSLLFRTASGIIAITLVVGGLTVLLLSFLLALESERDAYKRLGELLDTVENTVRIASFVNDETLAREVAQGLLKAREIRRVIIRTHQQELAWIERPASHDRTKRDQPLQRDIVSPFDPNQVLGNITLSLDPEVIEQAIAAGQQRMAVAIGLLILGLAIAVVLQVTRQVIKPIISLSKRLTEHDATSGTQLAAPRGHEQNVLGNLTSDINALCARLVSTIKQEQALRLQHEVDNLKYRSIFDKAKSGIFVADRTGLIDSYNRSMSRLCALPPPTKGQGYSLTALPWLNPAQLVAFIEQCLSRSVGLAEDFELSHPALGSRWLNLSLTPISEDVVQGIVSDVTERRKSESIARRLATNDHLTGLPNRQGFENYWKEQIASHPDEPFALLFIDLDGFKQINDALGITTGDNILIGMGARIAASLKETDWLSRIGGDEFAVVLPGANHLSTIEKICQRLVKQLGESFMIDDQEACLGASIGAAFFPLDADNLAMLLSNAELAQTHARQSGGRTWRLFDPSMAHAIKHRHQLTNDLRQAIEHGEFRLFYQPIVDIRQHRVIGAEALIRWFHPVHGLVPPDNFIGLAEETGLISTIGEWCLRTACQQLAAWRAQGHDLRITINVSARQIPDGLPPKLIAAIATEHGIPTDRIGLEITESLLVTDACAAQDWLADVRQLGCRAYLDDFGTGYSSLSYLKRFEVDAIKIDKLFVRDINNDTHDRVMVDAVIMMAGSFDLKVVAEGIEEPAQLETLKRIGCDFGQGFLFSRPLPAEQFLAQIALIDAASPQTAAQSEQSLLVF